MFSRVNDAEDKIISKRFLLWLSRLTAFLRICQRVIYIASEANVRNYGSVLSFHKEGDRGKVC